MIFLYNRERVMFEIAQLATLQISDVLKVDPSVVTPKVEMAGGKPALAFDVDMDSCEGVEESEVKEVLASVYHEVKDELNRRLSDLRGRSKAETKA